MPTAFLEGTFPHCSMPCSNADTVMPSLCETINKVSNRGILFPRSNNPTAVRCRPQSSAKSPCDTPRFSRNCCIRLPSALRMSSIPVGFFVNLLASSIHSSLKVSVHRPQGEVVRLLEYSGASLHPSRHTPSREVQFRRAASQVSRDKAAAPTWGQ